MMSATANNSYPHLRRVQKESRPNLGRFEFLVQSELEF